MPPQHRLQSLFTRADALTDALQARLRRLSPQGPYMIMPYKGYGTSKSLGIAGRVLRDPGFISSLPTHSRWRNLVEVYKRLESDEVPGARLRCRYRGAEQEVSADEEGYFGLHLPVDGPLHAGMWQEAQLQLLSPATEAHPVSARAQVLVPATTARFGVISDIDDTVLQSDVAHKLRMLLLVALSNAHTRKPFPGVAAFYRALQRGRGDEGNPLFYVSSSPWNLFAPLVEFLDVQGIPGGPLLLKDFGDHTLFDHRDHLGHKLKSIEDILRTYPALPFILIGDSGEQDPEIYAEVVRRHPGRIRAIYIRNVGADAERLTALAALIREVRELHTQLVVAPDSEFAAAHAAGEGLISAQAWMDISEARREDDDSPHPDQISDGG